MTKANCNIETGMCENEEGSKEVKKVSGSPTENLKLMYFTDPICSACYIFEKNLAQFLMEHRNEFSYSIHMGGLVPDKNSFFDPGNGIHSAKDVGQHWKEMGQHFGMDLNVSMWETDPMDSSYPPSIAVKAAELQSKEKGEEYLKLLRDAVFIRGENIEHQLTLDKYAEIAKLDIDLLHQNQNGAAMKAFFDDLTLMQNLGVRGFPSLVFQKEEKLMSLSGIHPLKTLEEFYLKAKEM